MGKAAALVSIALSSFVMPFLGNAINTVAPLMASDLGVSIDKIAFLQLVLTLSTATAVIPLGRLADVIGRTLVYKAGLALLTAATAFLTQPLSYPLLIPVFVLVGIGAAAVFGSNNAILISLFPPGERGRAIGINTLAVYIGLTAGSPVGGFLASYSWRSIFAIATFVAIVSFTMARGIARDKAAGRYDLAGALLFSTSLFSLLLGATSPYLIAMGLILLIAFGIYESKVPAPLVSLDMFKNLKFSAAVAAAFLNYAATYAVVLVLSYYLHLRSLPTSIAGLLLMSQPVLMAAFSPVSGWLSDRVEPSFISAAGLGLVATALAMMSTLDFSTPLHTLGLELALLGLGLALFVPPNTNIIMSSVDARDRGLASAVVATARLTGQSLSAALAASILSNMGGLDAVRTSIAIYASISVFAILLSILRICRQPF